MCITLILENIKDWFIVMPITSGTLPLKQPISEISHE